MLSVISLDRRLYTATLRRQEEMWDHVLDLLARDLTPVKSVSIELSEDEVLEDLHFGRN